MAVEQPVPVETPDSSTEDGKREQSTILFPYQDLDEGLVIAKAVHDLNGSSCQVEQVAAQVKQSPTSSAFRLRVTTAKTFGLVTASQGIITLTNLGSRICDPQQEKAARVDSFLAVPLYTAVYEKFKGMALPPTAGLEAALVSLGVAQKQKDRARQVLQRSAQSAGFFQFGTDRLVLPAIKNMPPPAPEHDDEDHVGEKKKKTKGGGGGDGGDLHPFIQGLLTKLPPPDTEWPTEGRTKWLQAAVNIFELMYTDSDDSRKSISVEAKKDSAR